MSLAREFRDRGKLAGQTLILGPTDAVAMVERARSQGVGILGIDGFWIADQTTQPDMRHSIDLGEGGNWNEAVRFIEERSALGLSFEVVADEDTEDLRDPPR